MLSSLFDFKDDGALWIEVLDVIAGEIYTRIEDETIHAGSDRNFVGHQIRRPSIRICRSFPEQNPAARGFHFKSNRHARSGPAACGIKDVCSDGAHGLSNFSNLKRVIFLCSSLAM